MPLVRKTFLCRGVFRRAILSFLSKRVKHPIMTDFRGVPIILQLDNTTERKVLFGHYDLKELDFLKGGYIRDDPVFVDVGANCGFYTQNFLALGKGVVLAIEPNPKMCERVMRNYDFLQKKSTAPISHLILENYAVGEVECETHLDLNLGAGAASIVNSINENTIKVSLLPLKNILSNNNIDKIDVLKIDIEGFEDRALVPFFESSPKSLWPKRIVIEHTSKDEWKYDLSETFESCGYNVIEKTRGNLLLQRG